ncbi:MAG: SDR family oxidoreductase [Rhodospirillaceae bacterium]|jgi:NAD(P)-dependent dehydrogenase (short-subunit alcohol dehydrogenase family)|nr:SDR family oxidoreductase [Rhodospirillaceae bacterium]MBT5455415.1 SDR family oxidoreductase [Rhodospirillaceae bacterium]
MKLKDKVAIVTGAGRNIGEETAKLFVSEGAKVAVVDMDEARGSAVADALNAANAGVATYIKANVADESSVKDMIAATVEAFGRIDVLVNNVAISDNLNIRECTLADFQKTIDVTLTSQFIMCKWVGERMIEQGDGGAIVNIGSTSGFRGRDSAVAYAAAKGGVANLMRAIAIQLAPFKIRVNSVVPNKIGSPVGQQDFDPTRPVPNLVGRAGLPEELAKGVLFLVSDDSSFVFGENLFVDGGYSAMM